MGNTCACDVDDDRRGELEIDDYEDIKQISRALRAKTHKKGDLTPAETEFLKKNESSIKKIQNGPVSEHSIRGHGGGNSLQHHDGFSDYQNSMDEQSS